ncbi:IS1 family transposase [Flammeovirga aprica]|uniref:IS1 family transposase n=1 Tax=Flammeovirga aprica JL-4 TaxID=694437 RepID=A0A7X9NZK5_9BACT|nr:IS1 family transposase [Flammeovirga aprica]NME66575.1 IS1 family transposase [Flammeovirga aprica JL-4]
MQISTQDFCCVNEHCHARGHYNKGNIIGHNLKKGRLKCKECGKTFSTRALTPMFRKRHSLDHIRMILMLILYGCPLHAIEKVFSHRRETINQWILDFGDHFENIHHQLVVQPIDHKKVELDELYSSTPGGKNWITSAISSTYRLWLGGHVSNKRNTTLINKLCEIVAKCCDHSKFLLIATDGLSSYKTGIKKYFNKKIPRRGKIGRSSYYFPENIVLIQCIKSYVRKGKRYVCHGVDHCDIALGNLRVLPFLMKKLNTTGVVHTAYIERFNATLRSSIHTFTRRSRSSIKNIELSEKWLYLFGGFYNFCRIHQSLKTTPAVAAGIVNQVFSFDEMVNKHRTIKKWTPPKKKGRPLKKDQIIIDKWYTHN